MYSSAVFAGADLFALKFYLDKVVSINHSWRQKATDIGLSDGEERIPLYFLVLTQYRSVTDRQTDRRTDGRTDGRICRSIYSACKAGFTERCKNYLRVCLSVCGSVRCTVRPRWPPQFMPDLRQIWKAGPI